jgi:cyclic lactone autoinducer peptide
MKGRLLAFAASLIAKAGGISVKPMCVAWLHQPKVPDKLLNK